VKFASRCNQYSVWFHVDGAFGALRTLSRMTSAMSSLVVRALQRRYDVRSLASTLGRNAAYSPGVTPSVLLKQRFK
jgi:hypothetical protein